MLRDCQLAFGLYQRMAGQEQGITFEKPAAKAAIRIKLLTAHPNDAWHIEMQHCILSCRLESTFQYHNFTLHAVNLESQHLC